MKNVILTAVLMVALIIPSCRFSQSFDTHEFSPGPITRRNEPSYHWSFQPLRGNDYDHLLTAALQGSNSHMLLIKDQIGKDISQINFPNKIRGTIVLTDPRNKKNWLFLSINDQKSTTVRGYHYVWENTLQREEKEFAAIPRTDKLIDRTDYEWYGTLFPKILEDIDNDGKPELVCLAQDAYTVNPRGLVVFDFDSGKLKWRFDLSTSIVSLLCGDFNGNGAKELVCGTIAYKNTREELRGMDDFHSWLFVLNPQGELLHYEMANEGFSRVMLAADDIDNDGTKEILAISSTKGNVDHPNTVRWLNWTGSRFIPKKTWSLAGNLEVSLPDTYYSVMDGTGRKLILMPALNSPLVVLDQELNEVHHNFRDLVSYVWGVEDIDLDGKKEILLQTLDNRFVILNSDLRPTAEHKNPYSLEESYQAHIVNTGFGIPRKIAIASSSEVRYFNYRYLPPGVLLGRFIMANLLSLILILALIIILQQIMIQHRRKVFELAANNLSQGVILVIQRNRIVLINNYMLDLIRDENGNLPAGNLRSLANLYPCISALLPDFIRGKTQQYDCTLKLGRQQVSHSVRLQKLPGMTAKTLITMQPEIPDTASNSATLAWADTARRLSHNVRRHITNVILALKPLQADGLDDTQLKYTNIIRSEIEKIRVFTHAFQRFTELKDYDLKLQDVIPSVEHCLERLSIPANIELMKNWDLSSVETWIEPIRFEEALANVLSNALDAMPGGGTLHLSVKKFTNHAGQQGRQSVMIEVEDSGKGIPAKYLEEIWQPFFTTKESGTGIGLPETKKIIESMGGTVLVQSEEGSGTVVTFWLKGSSDG